MSSVGDLLSSFDIVQMFNQFESLTRQFIIATPQLVQYVKTHFIPEVYDIPQEEIAEDFMKWINKVYPSGSIVEGATSARLVNPQLPKEHLEIETDFLLKYGTVSAEQIEKGLVRELPYAKGYVWIIHDRESPVIDQRMLTVLKPDDFLMSFENECYLKASAFRTDLDWNCKA